MIARDGDLAVEQKEAGLCFNDYRVLYSRRLRAGDSYCCVKVCSIQIILHLILRCNLLSFLLVQKQKHLFVKR